MEPFLALLTPVGSFTLITPVSQPVQPPGPVDPGYSPPWAQVPPGTQPPRPVDPGYSPPWAQVPPGTQPPGPVDPGYSPPWAQVPPGTRPPITPPKPGDATPPADAPPKPTSPPPPEGAWYWQALWAMWVWVPSAPPPTGGTTPPPTDIGPAHPIQPTVPQPKK